MGKFAEDRGNGVREQVIDTAANMVTRYSGVTSFLDAPTIPQGIVSISESGIPIDLLNSNVGSDTTIVLFHGAIEPERSLPVLTSQGVSTAVGANRVFISDPSLYLSQELRLGWYAGSSAQPNLQDQVYRIIERIIASHGARRVVFFGGSGGGFASLYFAARFPNSAAVVFNPQTNIAKHNGISVQKYANIAYGVPIGSSSPVSEITPPPVTNVCELYSDLTNGFVIYIQNLNDEFHVNNHMRPFLDAVHHETPVFTIQDSWEEGHAPPPGRLLTEVLAGVCAVQRWPEDVKEVVDYVNSPSFKSGTIS